MICTIIRNTNGTREIQYGQQHLANSKGIESYTYVNISEVEVQQIRDATTDKVQELLKDLY